MSFDTQAARHTILALTTSILPVAEGSLDASAAAIFLGLPAEFTSSNNEVGTPGPGYEVLQGRSAARREQRIGVEYVPTEMSMPLADLQDVALADLVSTAPTHAAESLASGAASIESLSSGASSQESLSSATASRETLV